jgi:hypothetical protein
LHKAVLIWELPEVLRHAGDVLLDFDGIYRCDRTALLRFPSMLETKLQQLAFADTGQLRLGAYPSWLL